MKKLICVLVSILLIATSAGFSVYAERGGNGNSENIQTDKYDNGRGSESFKMEEKGNAASSTQSSTIVTLKEQLKENHKDKTVRKELIKRLVELRRQNNDKTIPLYVYGEEVVLDSPPVIKLGRMVVPVRPITNALGAEVKWDSTAQTITVSKDVYGQGMTTIILTLGSNIALVNGKEVEVGAKAEIISNRTMVPVRFIAETLKQKVDYDSEVGAVIIDEDENNTNNTVNTSSGAAATVNLSQ